MSSLRIIFSGLLVIFTASCVYTGGLENPVTRKFSWFSYVNGDDIRKVCADLGADRYRFVYNAVYDRQTRSYDVFFHDKKIKTLVTGPAAINKLHTSDMLAPWRGVISEVQVSDKELNALKKSLITSDALQPAPDGLYLYSDKFYWTVAACVDGQFHFHAYLWPSEDFDRVKFDDELFALDDTGVDVEQPKRLGKMDLLGGLEQSHTFLLEVGKNGLVGFEGG